MLSLFFFFSLSISFPHFFALYLFRSGVLFLWLLRSLYLSLSLCLSSCLYENLTEKIACLYFCLYICLSFCLYLSVCLSFSRDLSFKFYLLIFTRSDWSNRYDSQSILGCKAKHCYLWIHSSVSGPFLPARLQIQIFANRILASRPLIIHNGLQTEFLRV